MPLATTVSARPSRWKLQKISSLPRRNVVDDPFAKPSTRLVARPAIVSVHRRAKYLVALRYSVLTRIDRSISPSRRFKSTRQGAVVAEAVARGTRQRRGTLRVLRRSCRSGQDPPIISAAATGAADGAGVGAGDSTIEKRTTTTTTRWTRR